MGAAPGRDVSSDHTLTEDAMRFALLALLVLVTACVDVTSETELRDADPPWPIECLDADGNVVPCPPPPAPSP